MTKTHQTRRAVRLAAVMLVSSAAVSLAQPPAENYTQWRGQNRDGSASAFSPPKTWPDKLTLKWKVEIGAGYATPLVVGSRVYTIARQGGDEVMMALDAASGKTIWQTRYAAPYKMNPATAAHGEGPKSTPLFHEGRIYSLGISGIVSAFSASDGKLLWQKAAPQIEPMFGTAMSPIADQNVVIFHVGGHDKGALTAFDAKTGDVKWEWPGDGPAYGSPMVVDIAGTRQLITVTQQKIVGLDVANGRLLWERPFKTGSTTSSITPIVFGDIIIESGQAAGTIAFRPVRRDAQWSTELIWETNDVEMKLSNPVIVNDTLYGLSIKASGQLFALDPRTGEILWRGKAREATNLAIVKAGDLLFLLNDDGELTVAKSSRSAFEPLHKYTVAESATWAQPSIVGNRIFVKDVSTLALWMLL